MNFQRYTKGILAGLGAASTVATLAFPQYAFIGDPEFQASVAAGISAVLVVLMPNKDEPEVEAAKERARLTKRVRRG